MSAHNNGTLSGADAATRPTVPASTDNGTSTRPAETKRPRATKHEQAQLDRVLVELIERAGPPCTARQVYYMAVGAGVMGKTDNDYRRVLRRLSALRESGELRWDWIADNSRWVRQATAWRSLPDALEDWQHAYRRDHWATQPTRVELWVESDSIASFINADVMRYGLPMFVCRGQASRTYVRAAAEESRRVGKPVSIIYIGDLDPSGLAIHASLAERRNRFADGASLTLKRAAVTAAHVAELNLIGTPAKRTDPNYRGFAAWCETQGMQPMAYETEALPPDRLREIVRAAIVESIDVDAWQTATRWEATERRQLVDLIGGAV